MKTELEQLPVFPDPEYMLGTTRAYLLYGIEQSRIHREHAARHRLTCALIVMDNSMMRDTRRTVVAVSAAEHRRMLARRKARAAAAHKEGK